MDSNANTAVAIVGVGAVMPDAPDADAFWANLTEGRYSITEVDPSRWDPALYYDPDPRAPDKAYSKIGGWVREVRWDPMAWRLPVPPRVADAMDDSQKWAVACARSALVDYGWPERALDNERTAVVLGNAMAGEKHYLTSLRIYWPEFARELEATPSFAALPAEVRAAVEEQWHERVAGSIPEITEDTMPGELSNIIAGRVANLFNLRGPNFVVDAACASAMAAMNAAVEGLVDGAFDTVLTGGIDRNMGAPSFIKFCKIGALSATGTRPYGDGADGFVMGEGAAVFLLKRLGDAEKAGDRIYAVVRSLAGSSDGKGKGITAPNPVGQRLAVERAWAAVGLSPASATYLEGHGTSTRVGDLVEVDSLSTVLAGAGAKERSVALGSVKSNIGHLKAAAGAAGLLKTALALHHRVIPPSLHAEVPNPDIDFAHSPLRVNTELREWDDTGTDGVRRAGVSAFGFGGTNFHAVLEEHVPGRLTGNGNGRSFAVSLPGSATAAAPSVTGEVTSGPVATTHAAPAASAARAEGPTVRRPLRGALVVGAADAAGLAERLEAVRTAAAQGNAPESEAPAAADLEAPHRVAIDYGDAAELADRCTQALRALGAEAAGAAAPLWKALRVRGVFRGTGPAPKVAFLYTGQGSQYVNMLSGLRQIEPVVRATFDEADAVMTPLLGRPLTAHIVVDPADAAAVEAAEASLRETEITQPAVLTVDTALTRLLAQFGIAPDLVMGHSLGEYGALVAAGSLTFEHALEAVSARGREMAHLSVDDRGLMAAVFAPLEEIEEAVAQAEGNVVVANVNSTTQAVVGGASDAVRAVVARLEAAGRQVVMLPVSHAFHTSIVAPASEPLRVALLRLELRPPRIPIVSNVTGGLYPMGDGVVPEMLDLLARQVASPVQFVDGLHTLYDAGARVFVEVGPKRALQGFAEDVVGGLPDAVALATNHPKAGDTASFNQALCGLYAAGLGAARDRAPSAPTGSTTAEEIPMDDSVNAPAAGPATADGPMPGRGEPVVITGAALGLPGGDHVMDDRNVARILGGEQCIDVVPTRLRDAMLDKHITRLVKREDGDPTFEPIERPDEVIRLAGRGGTLDLVEEYGLPAERVAALDRATRLAIAAGIDALRDAGIPLVMHYRTTSRGTHLPERWGLPDAMRDDTGVVFASAFPGYDALVADVEAHGRDRALRERLADLGSLRARLAAEGVGGGALAETDRRIAALEAELADAAFAFDRRFLFRILSMGHSQFAETIGARGPNTQVNAACASTTQALAVAEDWIATGRCRRVVIVAGDDVTSDAMLGWIGAGFLASGAAATDDAVEDAALPFDRRRHGMLLGMGAAALVVESAGAARERGVTPICEVLSTVVANSAYHGTRLDVSHITGVMETLMRQAEERAGVRRDDVAKELVFVSHETYTPARGGSAAAEVDALRGVFGETAGSVVVANTKGFTGHPMGVGIEDVVAVKALECGLVPAVPNFREVDPTLGTLNLSLGGAYPVRYALRLAAGFGSQIGMALLRWTPPPDGARHAPDALGYRYRTDEARYAAWLRAVCGAAVPELEVVRRTLRVRETAPAVVPAVAVQPAVAPVEPAMPVVGVPAVASPQPAAPTAAAAPDVAAATTVAAAAVDEDSVRDTVLAMVAEKTGYPPDMLDPDLDMEADLGVDTVKQAELFALVRERYGIERDPNLKLRDFPTLRHVVGFVVERSSTSAAAATGVAEAAPTAAPPASAVEPAVAVEPAAEVPATPALTTPSAAVRVDDEAVEAEVLALVAEKTGYPPDMLDLDLDMEADLGVDTVKQAEIFATLRERYGIERDPNLKLRDFPTLRHVVRFMAERASGAVPEAVAAAEPAVAAQTVAVTATVPAHDGSGDGAAPTVVATPPIEAAAIAEAAPSARTASPVDSAAVETEVLALVAEKTGYPPDMLDLDLDMEADLGVDTVKQAEIFATLRERYGIERDPNLKLRDFPTLRHVVRFMAERSGGGRPGGGGPDGAPGGAAPAAPGGLAAVGSSAGPAPTAPTPAVTAPPPADLAAADRLPRRVPVPVLRPPIDLCVPTGVSFAGVRVAVMPDDGGAGTALARVLEERGATVLVLDASARPEALDAAVRDGEVGGLFWLPALDVEAPVAAMDLASWRSALHRRATLLHAAVRALPESAFVVGATRLGGLHGYGDVAAVAPMGGAVCGYLKALARERPAVTVKVVDVEAGATSDGVAAMLVEEAVSDPGAVEIGRARGLRWSVGLDERAAADGGRGVDLGPSSVVMVTGAAGGIVAAIVADLARAARGGVFHLLDVVAEPDPSDPDLARVGGDRDALRRDLAERIRAAGERPTPAMVERRIAALERSAAALSAITTVREAGGVARWHRVDLTDGGAVDAVVAQVRAGHDHIDVLLHAAGIEVSRLVPDKDLAEFERVVGVKADGWFNLLHALEGMPLGAVMAFSSVAGRFGNGGQVDYSAANDLLCKHVSAINGHGATRAVAVDWTAWAGIGMATRGSIPTMMRAAGIEMLQPEVGVPTVRRELCVGSRGGEVVVGGALGILLEERHPTGGLDVARAAAAMTGPMRGTPTVYGVISPLSVEITLDPAAQPFLDHHRIDGIPVLPGVMGVEAFAETAALLAPAMSVAAVEGVEFLAPLKFYRDQPRILTVTATFRAAGDAVVAECALTASRVLSGRDRPQTTTHFTGRVRLLPSAPDVPADHLPEPRGAGTGPDDVYRVYFHGPSYRVLDRVWCESTAATGRLHLPLPPASVPVATTATAPRLLELCFQTAGILELTRDGVLALPRALEAVTAYRPQEPVHGEVRARVVAADGGGFDAEVVDESGAVLLRMHGYGTVPLPLGLSDEALAPFRTAPV